jgi:murein DD-endopeptidase MepM/ murein hydrolase activator NlpD
MESDSPLQTIFAYVWQGSRRWRLPLVAFLGILLIWIGNRHPATQTEYSTGESPATRPSEKLTIVIPAPPPWPRFSHPSPQRQWDETENPKVYMPTGSGRVASAGYGSVRTNSSGRATFHEGVDIAPVKWDSRRRAADDIFAASDGVIRYINRFGGNSSYGIYIIIEHQDDVGGVYTLYAHLASVPRELKAGQSVKLGQVIARMGHSSTLGIPVQRSHLHFEMGMMLNPSFDKWYRAKKMTPNHGRYHGFNFVGLDPRLMLKPLTGKEEIPYSYLHSLENKKPAWHLLIKSKGRPRYFEKYPRLWNGSPYNKQVMLLELSESGIPLSGRNATDSEIELLGSAKNRVSLVDEEVLGRNGLRHVVKSRGKWILGNNGSRWLEILMYDAR